MSRSGKARKPRGSKKKSPGSKRKSRGPGPWGSAFRWTLKWGIVSFVWLFIAMVAMVAWYAYDLPDVNKIEAARRAPAVVFKDRNGVTLASYGDLYGSAVRLADVPKYLPQAVIATEDRRFYHHIGIDFIALTRALWVNIRHGQIREGGSTISQQLAKNLFLTRERTVRRKVQETLLAFWLERRFTKDQILTIYLNRVYLGAGTYGVDAAARRYFGKSARHVNLYEAAMLAGLLKAPSRHNPANDPNAAANRAKIVLLDMVEAGYITKARAARALEAKHTLRSDLAAGGRHYFADWVRRRIKDYAGEVTRDLIVTTTLDAGLQKIAEEQLARYLDKYGPRLRVGQGALLALSTDGAVRAMVGGRDYQDSKFNRVTQARRQPGSAFKPFVFLAAIESGIEPDAKFVDAPVRIGRWRPKNYHNKYYGEVTLRESVTRSLNSVAVRVSEKVGRGKVIRVARRLGIRTRLRAHPSIALGASEVTMLELTGAYATLANNGIGIFPYGIVEIKTRGGRVLYRRRGSGLGRVVAASNVAAMNDVLRAVMVWGTGKAARLPDRPAAGKTGTSQDFRDAWFIGYTPDLITGVWVGNDDARPMKGVTGGSLPAWIWKGFMIRALKGRSPKKLPGVAWSRGD
ncbi:MAG: PBP1A family penicillin-binding protein [Alphaproteobacteria bacterium]